MARTRRLLTRVEDQFDDSGEDWQTDTAVDLSATAFTTIDLPFSVSFSGVGAITRLTIWEDGFVSFGDVTQAQLDWAATHAPGSDIFTFPGNFIAVGFLDVTSQFQSVQYTAGVIDFEPPYDRAEAVDILRVTWSNQNFNSFQLQLTRSDFAIVDLSVSSAFDDPGQIGFRIGTYRFDPTQQAMPDYFFTDTLGGSFTGNGFANTIEGGVRADFLSGAAGYDHLIGNAGNDTLDGGSGNDLLDGGTGADTMTGGSGNDTYSVDNAGDIAIEDVSGGEDRVNSSVTFTLGANVENLVLTGAAAINGTGNRSANYVYGNGAANVLNGGAGHDTMIGGDGNDIYIVNSVGDRVMETSATGGTDRVNSMVSYSLGANLENLVLTGTLASNGTGNGLANSITGNASANIIDGRGGADIMTGGGGNDTYFIDNAGDQVVEASGGGIDRVMSAISLAMPAFVEQLELTGTSPLNGTGNGLSNIIKGNSGANILDGMAGSDQLYGGSGNDILTGGSGADRFFFDTGLDAGSNVDRITDFSAPDDTIQLDRTVFTAIVTNGTLASAAFFTGTTAHDADDRIIYDAATGRIFYDSDGTGAAAPVLFAEVGAGATVTNLDFVAYI